MLHIFSKIYMVLHKCDCTSTHNVQYTYIVVDYEVKYGLRNKMNICK